MSIRQPRASRALYAAILTLGLALGACDSDGMGGECMPDETLAPTMSEVVEVAEDHHEVTTSIVIDAAAADVWAVLTDFEAMPQWSSSFQGLAGDVRDGGEVMATFIFVNPATGEEGPISVPHVLSYVEGESFGWSDPIAGYEGISDDHQYRVESISECQTRFVQSDAFQGTHDGITTAILADLVNQSYTQFNSELKAEVERRAAQ